MTICMPYAVLFSVPSDLMSVPFSALCLVPCCLLLSYAQNCCLMPVHYMAVLLSALYPFAALYPIKVIFCSVPVSFFIKLSSG